MWFENPMLWKCRDCLDRGLDLEQGKHWVPSNLICYDIPFHIIASGSYPMGFLHNPLKMTIPMLLHHKPLHPALDSLHPTTISSFTIFLRNTKQPQHRKGWGKACCPHPCCCGPGGWLLSLTKPSSPGARNIVQMRAPKHSRSARQQAGTVAKPQEAGKPHRAAN